MKSFVVCRSHTPRLSQGSSSYRLLLQSCEISNRGCSMQSQACARTIGWRIELCCACGSPLRVPPPVDADMQYPQEEDWARTRSTANVAVTSHASLSATLTRASVCSRSMMSSDRNTIKRDPIVLLRELGVNHAGQDSVGHPPRPKRQIVWLW